ncbi:MAG TPA: IS66 family insertion sequence element accessory protein TnpB [Steroidobacteraceae bacterium]|nr:IS66 family insertion sequence element accessory protein TnpB [Steroidobacteraceae bacterium]
MFELPTFRKAYLLQTPVNMRWGEKKLTELCMRDIGVEPKIGDAFLFFNAKRDSLKLFFHDRLGSNDLQKHLPRGGFMLPAPIAGQAYVEIAPTLVRRLFGRQ